MTTTLSAAAPSSILLSAARDRAAQPLVRKVTGSKIATSILKRAFHPVHLWTAAKLHHHRKVNRRSFDDTRLALYAQMLPSEFLHYGFFEQTNLAPDEISLAELARAQTRYAEHVLELVGTPAGPVLDAGCGMGGFSRLLLERGLKPVALTPDRLQAAHIAKSLPDVPVLRCKLEALPVAENQHRFAAVITAESLQYMKLPNALHTVDAVLQPGGSWIICDYFLTRPSSDQTCHDWGTFREQISRAGWRLVSERDITANVLPTLRFLHMLATRFGLPLMEFMTLRLRRKQPGLHHILLGMLGQLHGLATDNLGLIDPAQFARDRQYMLLKLERQ